MEGINQEVNSVPSGIIAENNIIAPFGAKVAGDEFYANPIATSSPALAAGNTTQNLQPGFGPRTSEVIHASTITTKPEPTEEVREVAKFVLENESAINAALAEQGQQLNRAALLEAATLPNPSVAAVETSKQRAADIVADVEPVAISDLKIELADLKQQINDSFSEVASLLLDLATRFDLLDERINRYNMKSSHKI